VSPNPETSSVEPGEVAKVVNRALVALAEMKTIEERAQELSDRVERFTPLPLFVEEKAGP